MPKQNSDVFSKKGEISKQEVGGFLERLAPGVKIEMEQHTPVPGGCGVSLSYLMDETKRKVMGYILGLPFVKKGEQGCSQNVYR